MRKFSGIKYFGFLMVLIISIFTYLEISNHSVLSVPHNSNSLPKKGSDSSSKGNVDMKSSINERVSFKIDDLENVDGQIEDYLTDLYPIISDKAIEQIQASKEITKKLTFDSASSLVEFYLNFDVPKYYLTDNVKFFWELNIAAFQSHLYQLYNNDTILIDIWPNVVGKPSTKTYTGHYQAFRLRNWPSWKDPESADSVRPTPPGPNNPLGLFVVHYDENSLRYFHGTNKNYLLKNEVRALSHGCVRNLNENIAKMKEFIVKKIIKSDDLSGWLGSKRSMTYEIKEADRFPVRIIYKTFEIASDEYGYYIIFYKDVYNYEQNFKLSKYDDPDLITFATEGNVINEYSAKKLSNKYDNDKIIPILKSLVDSHSNYQKYYFDDLLSAGQKQN